MKYIPLTHGELAQKSITVSQLTPVNPAKQLHAYVVLVGLTQLPDLHGFDEHGSICDAHVVPVKNGGHWQV